MPYATLRMLLAMSFNVHQRQTPRADRKQRQKVGYRRLSCLPGSRRWRRIRARQSRQTGNQSEDERWSVRRGKGRVWRAGNQVNGKVPTEGRMTGRAEQGGWPATLFLLSRSDKTFNPSITCHRRFRDRGSVGVRTCQRVTQCKYKGLAQSL